MQNFNFGLCSLFGFFKNFSEILQNRNVTRFKRREELHSGILKLWLRALAFCYFDHKHLRFSTDCFGFCCCFMFCCCSWIDKSATFYMAIRFINLFGRARERRGWTLWQSIWGFGLHSWNLRSSVWCLSMPSRDILKFLELDKPWENANKKLPHLWFLLNPEHTATVCGFFLFKAQQLTSWPSQM